MEEKVLIKSEKYNVKKFFVIMVIIGAVLSIVVFSLSFMEATSEYDDYYERYLGHQSSGSCGRWYDEGEKCPYCTEFEMISSKMSYAFAEAIDNPGVILPVLVFTFLGGLIYLWLRSYELTVTDKRIYGKVAWGKRVDLPVDSISAISTIRLLKGVSVSTSSGKISFRLVKNADEIYKVMNDLLVNRQQEKANATVAAAAPVSDTADQIKKFKDLLDGGAISQEEFDAKKKQLLGL